MARMNHLECMQSKISARDRAQRLMNHLTAGVAVAAIAGVGVFGYVSAATIPGSTQSSTATATSTATPTTSSTSSSSSSALSPSSGTVSSSSGSGVAVSGGS
jgi:hypothetical protein